RAARGDALPREAIGGERIEGGAVFDRERELEAELAHVAVAVPRLVRSARRRLRHREDAAHGVAPPRLRRAHVMALDQAQLDDAAALDRGVERALEARRRRTELEEQREPVVEVLRFERGLRG